MKITVFQIKFEHQLKFRGYDEIVKAQNGCKKLDRTIYDEVYSGDVDCKNPEDIFFLLNYGKKPEDYKGHSLSTSDIVQTPDGLYFCDRYGWEKIEFATSQD